MFWRTGTLYNLDVLRIQEAVLALIRFEECVTVAPLGPLFCKRAPLGRLDTMHVLIAGWDVERRPAWK